MANRLREIREKLNLTQQSMAVHLGIGKSALSMIETGKASLSQRNKNILVQKLNVNLHWLNTGDGEMFDRGEITKDLTPNNEVKLKAIPLYSTEGNFNFSSLFKKNNNISPIDYISIPNVGNCDGAIYMIGDSMYPRLNAGDIILYKKMATVDDVFWGEMYLISMEVNSEEYVTVKVLNKSEREGYISLVSDNKHYDQKDVEMKKIKAIAMIKASINLR